MTQWTPQQLKCLKAIGVPVYAHVPRDRQTASARDIHENPAKATIAQPPNTHKGSPEAKVVPAHGNSEGAANTEVTQPNSTQQDPAETQSQNNPATPYYYQLGPWVFELEQTLPVESFDWLRDLAAYCKSTPTQVSHADKPIKLDSYARNKLSPAAKQALWRLLKAAR